MSPETIEQIRTITVQHRNWKDVRKALSGVFEQIERELSAQEVFDLINTPVKFAPCGKEKRFRSYGEGYRFCGGPGSCPCAKESGRLSRQTLYREMGVTSPFQLDAVKEKSQKTMQERHGVDHPAHSTAIREKTQKTLMERYGVENAMNIIGVKDRIHETNLQKYGSRTPLGSETVREKSKATLEAKYGVDNAMKAETLRGKHRATMVERHGGENAMQVEKFKQAAHETNTQLYGGISPLSSSVIRDKSRITNMERHGNEYPARAHISPESLAVLMNANALVGAANGISLTGLADRLGVHVATICRYWHRHGIPMPKSSYEREIASWLDGLGIPHRVNDRTILGGRELDFVIPQHNLAIEFNGLYWHSSLFKDRLYHREKYETCHRAGIRLLMINEDEWGPAWKDRLRNILGKSPRGVGARQTHLREITKNEANRFYDVHHIQGATGSIQYSMGAFHNGDMVGAMSFTDQRGIRGSTELIRFSTNGESHAGLFSRLFRHATREKNYTGVVSFADLRHSLGGVYHRNGFELVSEIPPDYQYIVGGKTLHKSNFTKAKIAKKFDIDMTTLTESIAMDQLGIPRIYDCGKLKFVWKR